MRQVRHDFNRILDWIADGEEVAITKRRRTVARLLPARNGRAPRRKMPDASLRLRRVFGGKILPESKLRKILNEVRREF